MKYSTRFYVGNKALQKADEVIIKFTPEHDDAGLLKYLETTTDKRVVVDMRAVDVAEHIGGLEAAKLVNENFTIMLDIYTQVEDALTLYENKIKFFFCNPADNWSELMSQIWMNVSDVYVSGELGFDLISVSKCCHQNNVNIRIVPNIVQRSNRIDNIDNIYNFWIRPEDLPLMEQYIDVIEFAGDLTRQNVYMKIYKDHQWLGDLSDLVIGLEGVNLYSDRLTPHWGQTRLSCTHRCLQARCDVCGAAKRFAAAMLEHADFRIKVVENDENKRINYEEYLKELKEDTLAIETNISEDFNIK